MSDYLPANGDAGEKRENMLTALELMGLAGLLRAWRAAAGEKRGLGRPITQKEVAEGIGRSVRWYIELENGATPRLERSVLDALARELILGPDQETTLHYYALGGTANTIPEPSADEQTRALLQLLLDQQMPNPAYISDISWNFIGYNKAMEEWFPWVRDRGANLMRWALRAKEARRWYVNWEHDAALYLEQVRFALAQHPRNLELQELIEFILRDPDCERLWHASTEVRKSGDGRTFDLALPRFDNEIVHAVSHALYPASLPNSRLVVINWLKDDMESVSADRGARDGAGIGGAASLRPDQPVATAGTGYAYRSVDTAEAAADLAGDDAVALPTLSRLVGGRCQLTLGAGAGTVIWATEQEDGRWTFEELGPYTAIKQLPANARSEAPEEYRLLVRAQLPSDPREAAKRIGMLLPDYEARIQCLTDIRRELSEQHPGVVAPVDRS